jgi:hypothetical protein
MTMDRVKIAQELVRLARTVVADELPSALTGMNKRQAVRFVNRMMDKHTKGFFKDNSWRPVHAIFKEMTDRVIHYELKSAKYGRSSPGQGMDDHKRWKFEIPFENDRGRPTTLYGVIVASGAGSVEDPLERYDLVAYVS